MVALSWAGHRVPEIADELGCAAKTVRLWLHRFNETDLTRHHVTDRRQRLGDLQASSRQRCSDASRPYDTSSSADARSTRRRMPSLR
ncbi:helix-turn-helix domain-containing protein [Kitasatospora sp. NPDC052896]|uniref:helix-turn-helix domain-containing protein n=1 Tax=Kitasatospora sp. NPDC052896 TaxID=3364061 RepID=UPI0037C971CE